MANTKAKTINAKPKKADASARQPAAEESISRVFEQLEKEENPTAEDLQIQELQQEVTKLERENCEQRFFLILVIVIIFDANYFTKMESWGGPIAILILELLGLILYAERCGVNAVKLIVDKLVDSYANNRVRKDE